MTNFEQNPTHTVVSCCAFYEAHLTNLGEMVPRTRCCRRFGTGVWHWRLTKMLEGESRAQVGTLLSERNIIPVSFLVPGTWFLVRNSDNTGLRVVTYPLVWNLAAKRLECRRAYHELTLLTKNKSQETMRGLYSSITPRTCIT